MIDLLNNGISHLGCQALGNTLRSLGNQSLLRQLLLDHNPLRDEGMKALSVGLRQSQTLEELSLNFCGLEEQSVGPIQQILTYVKGRILKLNLQGNFLGEKGCLQILRALVNNKTLKEINLSDNQIVETEAFQ